MDVAAIPPAIAAGTTQTTPETGRSRLSSDFETFLKMLTVQMQNQDPLNPVESADFAVQLATFSSVEQQVLTNDLLTGLGTQMGAMGLSQMAGWIGMEARSASPAYFTGQPIETVPKIATGADEANLVVWDAEGTFVQRVPAGLASDSVTWAGVDATGRQFPTGRYTFEMESLSRGEVMQTVPIESYTQIVEVRANAGSTDLVLGGGTVVAAGDITALREPS